MKKNQIKFAVIACTLIFFSCKPEPLKFVCEDKGIAKFLAVGHKWTYSYNEVLSLDTGLTMEITSQNSDGSYKMELTGGGTFGSLGGYTRNFKECSDWLLVNPVQEPTPLTDRTYPLNRTQDQTWTVQSVATYKVIQKNATITVPAGSFVCDVFTYHADGAINTDTIYFSDAVGYIKYSGFFNDFELTSKNF